MISSGEGDVQREVNLGRELSGAIASDAPDATGDVAIADVTMNVAAAEGVVCVAVALQRKALSACCVAPT